MTVGIILGSKLFNDHDVINDHSTSLKTLDAKT
jgi:hypothetical protein